MYDSYNYSVLQNLTLCKRGLSVLIFFVNSATFWFLVNLIFLVFFGQPIKD